MASVQKRGKNSYLLVVEAGYDANGKRIRRTKTVKAKNKTEAKSILAKFQAEVEAGEYIAPQKMKFDTFLEEWREKYAVKELSPSTLETYENHFRNHILPRFGHMNLDQIKPMHIVAFLDDLQKPGARKDGKEDVLSTGTVEVIYRAIKNVLTRAVEWEVIPKHPMENIKKPKVKYKKPQFLDEKEAEQIIAALFEEPRMWRLLILGAMIGGFRRGELIALEWKDVNFEENTIHVDENIPLTRKGQAVIKNPKSESSIATVDMPEWYMEDLKEWYKEWKVEKMKVLDMWEGGDREFVFHAGFGKPLYYTYPSEWWGKFLKRRGFKHIRFHDLRHTSAVLLLSADENVSLKVIQNRLRHSKYQTTADIYSHITKKVSKDAASKYEKFDPRKKQLK